MISCNQVPRAWIYHAENSAEQQVDSTEKMSECLRMKLHFQLYLHVNKIFPSQFAEALRTAKGGKLLCLLRLLNRVRCQHRRDETSEGPKRNASCWNVTRNTTSPKSPSLTIVVAKLKNKSSYVPLLNSERFGGESLLAAQQQCREMAKKGLHF